MNELKLTKTEILKKRINAGFLLENLGQLDEEIVTYAFLRNPDTKIIPEEFYNKEFFRKLLLLEATVFCRIPEEFRKDEDILKIVIASYFSISSGSKEILAKFSPFSYDFLKEVLKTEDEIFKFILSLAHEFPFKIDDIKLRNLFLKKYKEFLPYQINCIYHNPIVVETKDLEGKRKELLYFLNHNARIVLVIPEKLLSLNFLLDILTINPNAIIDLSDDLQRKCVNSIFNNKKYSKLSYNFSIFSKTPDDLLVPDVIENLELPSRRVLGPFHFKKVYNNYVRFNTQLSKERREKLYSYLFDIDFTPFTVSMFSEIPIEAQTEELINKYVDYVFGSNRNIKRDEFSFALINEKFLTDNFILKVLAKKIDLFDEIKNPSEAIKLFYEANKG